MAKDTSVVVNALIDKAVKRILTTVNHAFSLRFLKTLVITILRSANWRFLGKVFPNGASSCLRYRIV